jgi:hypothetical protein
MDALSCISNILHHELTMHMSRSPRSIVDDRSNPSDSPSSDSSVFGDRDVLVYPDDTIIRDGVEYTSNLGQVRVSFIQPGIF